MKATPPKISPRVQVVEASAGSGKTYALAKEYIKALLAVCHEGRAYQLDEILAITFTNKAAFEMKQRIIEFLKRLALDDFKNDIEKKDLAAVLNMSPTERKSKASLAIDNLLREYSFFQVKTIDSFINSMLLGCALKLGLSSSFLIEDTPDEYLEYSLDRLIDRSVYDKEKSVIFREFLEQYLLVENKEQWLPKRDIISLMGALLTISNIYGGEFVKYIKTSGDIIIKKRETYGLINELKKALPAKTNKQFVNAITKFLDKYNGSLDIRGLSRYFERDEFPATKGALLKPSTINLWKVIRGNLKKIALWESSARLNCYIDIYNELYGYFRELAAKEDVLFLQELNRRAYALLGSGMVSLNELYYRLSARIRCFFIDEFQDTSSLQWQNIFPIIKDALSKEGDLFYVGDKKQAVYRFRGGEAGLFDDVADSLSEFNINKTFLSTNYRSKRAIVELNNKVFSRSNLKNFIDEAVSALKDNNVRLSSKEIDQMTGVFANAGQEPNDKSRSGYVRVEPIEARNKDERDETTRMKIMELLNEFSERKVPLGSIAMLTRTNDEVETVTSWLLEKRIPVNSDRTSNIRDHHLIKEMISLLKFLNSPIDNLAFAAFILGDIFQAVGGIKKERVRKFLFELRKKSKGHIDTNIYIFFRKRYADAWDALFKDLFKRAGTVPLYEFVVSILAKFDILNHFPMHQGFIMKFLELVKDKEDRYESILQFLEYFENAPLSELYVNIPSADAVRVLTIHQSKGLEFEYVILPFFGINIKVGIGYESAYTGQKSLRSPSYVVYPKENKLKLMYLNKDYIAYSDELRKKYLIEFKKSFMDGINSSYVALTRAKEELYVFVPKKLGTKVNIARFLFGDDKLETGGKKCPRAVQKRKAGASIIKIPAEKPGDWIKILKDEFIGVREVANRRNIRKGDIYHCLFSFMGNLKEVDADEALKKAEEITALRYPASEELPRCLETVKRCINKPDLSPFFFVSDGVVLTEKEVMTANGDTKRVDRLIVKNKEVIILDYKSSRGEDLRDGYIEQIHEYKAIFSEIYPGKKVKGVLLYLDDLSVEEV